MFGDLGGRTHPEALAAAREHVRPDVERRVDLTRGHDTLAAALQRARLPPVERVVLVFGDCLVLDDVRAFAEFWAEPHCAALVRERGVGRVTGGLYVLRGDSLHAPGVARLGSPRRVKILPVARGYVSAAAARAAPDAFEAAVRPKVFGVGLGRTGTTSLTRALHELGWEIAHYPVDPRTLAQLEAGDLALDLLRHYDGLSDDHGAAWFRELDAAFPGSRFVLTVRDRDSWLTSMKRHWESKRPLPTTREGDLRRRMRRLVRQATYRCQTYDHGVLEQVHEEHDAAVKTHFRGRPEQLLVLELVDGGGWGPLCHFLGCPTPPMPFPHANRG